MQGKLERRHVPSGISSTNLQLTYARVTFPKCVYNLHTLCGENNSVGCFPAVTSSRSSMRTRGEGEKICLVFEINFLTKM